MKYIKHMVIMVVGLPMLGAFLFGVLTYWGKESLATLLGSSVFLSLLGILYFSPFTLIVAIGSGLILIYVAKSQEINRKWVYSITILSSFVYMAIILSIALEVEIHAIELILLTIVTGLIFSEVVYRNWKPCKLIIQPGASAYCKNARRVSQQTRHSG
jgi:hypothetical protein